MSDSLRPHGLQHTRLFCTPLSPRVCSNSRPLSWWCYLTISSSAAAFSFCLPPFPASRSFPMSQLLQSGSQSIRASAMASVLLKNSQGWIPLGLTGLISLWSKNLLRVFSSTTVRKQHFFGAQPSYVSTLTPVHDYWKNYSFDYMDLCQTPEHKLLTTSLCAIMFIQ